MDSFENHTQAAVTLLHRAASILDMPSADIGPVQEFRANAAIQMAAVWAQLADTALQAHGRTDTKAPAPSRLKGDLVDRNHS